jgi:hypothetical protein
VATRGAVTTAHQKREAIRRRDKGEESLAEIWPQLQRVGMDDCEFHTGLWPTRPG